MSEQVVAADAVVQQEDKPKGTKEPRNTRITQQALPACKPVLDRTWSIFIFMSMAIVLIPIGVVCLIFGAQPVEISYRYDDVCLPNLPDNDAREVYIQTNADNTAALTCSFSLEVTEDINGPVYVYYEIDGMYQNHRRYVRSRSDIQLAAASGSQQTGYCDPQEFFQGNTSQLINPCGLTAWTNFNDTYTLQLVGQRPSGPVNVALPVSDTGIAFPSDVKYRFGNYTPQFFNPDTPLRGGADIPGTVKEDQRFINWMRLSALPNFRKLWGVINVDLKAGDTIQVTAVNAYNTYAYNGKKRLVLGNTTWLGGYNLFLGLVYIITGGLSLLLGFIYTVVVISRPRKFGDVSLLLKPQ